MDAAKMDHDVATAETDMVKVELAKEHVLKAVAGWVDLYTTMGTSTALTEIGLVGSPACRCQVDETGRLNLAIVGRNGKTALRIKLAVDEVRTDG